MDSYMIFPPTLATIRTCITQIFLPFNVASMSLLLVVVVPLTLGLETSPPLVVVVVPLTLALETSPPLVAVVPCSLRWFLL